jgi:succinoglycan biosynthesis protein ExoU
LGLSTAPSVCVLDADDFMLRGRLAKLLAAAEDGTALVADNLFLAAAGEEIGPYRLLVPEGLQPRFLDLRGFVAANVSDPRRLRRELGFLKPLMSRAFLDKHGLRYDPRLRLGEDFILYASALARGGLLKLIDACGYVAVGRADSLSSNHEIKDLRALAVADVELASTAGLSAEEIAIIRIHQTSVAHRLHYREFLDAKRRKKWRCCLTWLLKSPGTLGHILSETYRAKLSKPLVGMWGREDAGRNLIYLADEDRLYLQTLLMRSRTGP